MTTAVQSHNPWPHTSPRSPRCPIPHHYSCSREARSRGGCLVFGHTLVLSGVKLKSVYLQDSGFISSNTGVKEQNPRATALPSISNLEDSWLSNSAAPCPFRLWRWPPEKRDIARALLNPPYNVSKLPWIQQDLVGAFLGKSWVSVSQWQVGSRVMGVKWGTCLTISTGKG